jgi:hypothetical protein
LLLTNEVTAADLPEDGILRVTPGIFQARVEKAHYYPRARERALATGPSHVDPDSVFVSREEAEG